jgi:hypothetical protein
MVERKSRRLSRKNQRVRRKEGTVRGYRLGAIVVLVEAMRRRRIYSIPA